MLEAATPPRVGYYDARDLSAVVALLLAAPTPQGDLQYRTASFDIDADQVVAQQSRIASKNAILIVDGTFLERPELRDHWHATLFVWTTADLAETRGSGRDKDRFGGEAMAREL